MFFSERGESVLWRRSPHKDAIRWHAVGHDERAVCSALRLTKRFGTRFPRSELEEGLCLRCMAKLRGDPRYVCAPRVVGIAALPHGSLSDRAYWRAWVAEHEDDLYPMPRELLIVVGGIVGARFPAGADVDTLIEYIMSASLSDETNDSKRLGANATRKRSKAEI